MKDIYLIKYSFAKETGGIRQHKNANVEVPQGETDWFVFVDALIKVGETV